MMELLMLVALLALVVTGMTLQRTKTARRRADELARRNLVGTTATVLVAMAPGQRGTVLLLGTDWPALNIDDQTLQPREGARVVEIDRLVAHVRCPSS